MKLTETPVTLRELRPSEGMWLTQTTNVESRVYSQLVYLGVNDSPDNWREATEDEKLAYEAEEKARMEAEIAEHEQEMSNE